MRKGFLRKLILPGVAMILMFVVNGIAQAQSNGPTTADLAPATNIMWTFITGFLVFFMQAGFALVETGFTRSKNVAHTMMMNMMVFCIGALGCWLVGFAFQFGGGLPRQSPRMPR
jgi:Amt family ammonium transporter